MEDSKEDDPLLQEDLVDRAYKFLTHPKVQNASLEKRVNFLKSKNLSDGVIERALHQSNLQDSDRANGFEAVEEGESSRARPKKGRRKPQNPTAKRRRPADDRDSSADGDWTVYAFRSLVCSLLLGVVVAIYFLLLYTDTLPAAIVWIDKETGHGHSSSSSAVSNATSVSNSTGLVYYVVEHSYSYAYSVYYSDDDGANSTVATTAYSFNYSYALSFDT